MKRNKVPPVIFFFVGIIWALLVPQFWLSLVGSMGTVLLVLYYSGNLTHKPE